MREKKKGEREIFLFFFSYFQFARSRECLSRVFPCPVVVVLQGWDNSEGAYFSNVRSFLPRIVIDSRVFSFSFFSFSFLFEEERSDNRSYTDRSLYFRLSPSDFFLFSKRDLFFQSLCP